MVTTPLKYLKLKENVVNLFFFCTLLNFKIKISFFFNMQVTNTFSFKFNYSFNELKVKCSFNLRSYISESFLQDLVIF